ncbi:MAG: endonuclease V [Candidatus Obscuribacterales bacterium]|nr:endonuclease V [Candidatus Obscuribacterales bacterium]
MIGCVDVQYTSGIATTALVVFDHWQSSSPKDTFLHEGPCDADYEPGNFYKRELPCILAALQAADVVPRTILVDGYVWLDGNNDSPRAGLGAHLFDAYDQSIAVIGVAKSRFQSSNAQEVLRGRSTRPLFITAAGIDPVTAANHVRDMHGESRIPTMIKLADKLARSKNLISS